MKRCDYCHRIIPSKVHPYTLRLELFPEVETSLSIPSDAKPTDLAAEMEKLVKLMAEMDEGEVIRQEKLMFVAHQFMLCPACRDKVAEKMESLKPNHS